MYNYTKSGSAQFAYELLAPPYRMNIQKTHGRLIWGTISLNEPPRFCFYPENKEESLKMLDFLRGPRPLSVMDKQFIADRFRDKDYVPRSYFEGATPANNYLPSEPYTVIVSDNPYSYQNETYATLYVRSGGADSLRSVQMRLAKDGRWYLWEQFILADIRQPESMNPWA